MFLFSGHAGWFVVVDIVVFGVVVSWFSLFRLVVYVCVMGGWFGVFWI